MVYRAQKENRCLDTFNRTRVSKCTLYGGFMDQNNEDRKKIKKSEVGAKIKKLKGEGKKQSQAVAIALSMSRKGKRK